MISAKITDIPKFMSLMFSSEVFDDFFLVEENVKTFGTFKIDGRLNPDFYDEKENLKEFATWREMRNPSREIIKGKVLPLKLTVLFMMPEDIYKKTFEGTVYETVTDLKLFMNVHFENGELRITTGTGRDSFTLDKEYEKMWDRELTEILTKLGLEYESEA
ncbi:MAG: hypothetical protein J6U37_00825 [Lachnospiraceae bacterium]|nr:hypothetical protein [Lachnospiraceae bacterium]